MNKLNIAIIGFGNAAKAFSKILIEKEKNIIDKYDFKPIITAIATNSRGCLISDEQLNIKELINMKNYFNHPKYTTLNSLDLIKQANYDLMIELTPLNIENGQPATEYIKTALKRGKHVITANKGPIAHAYQELKELANHMNVKLYYETTVMDGTPIFNLFNDTLPFCKVIGFEGILNTTTNYIITEMEKGISFKDALEKGRKQGFVEANPKNDLAGYDAAAKVSVLVNALMNKNIRPQQVQTEGIETLSFDDIAKATKNNVKIKLLCRAYYENSELIAEVKLKKLNFDHPLANINGTSSAITIKTDLMKDITIIENEPEINQTGFGIFSDMIRLIDTI